MCTLLYWKVCGGCYLKTRVNFQENGLSDKADIYVEMNRNVVYMLSKKQLILFLV